MVWNYSRYKINLLIILTNISSPLEAIKISCVKMVDSVPKGSYLAFIILGLIEKTTLTIMYCECHTWNPIIHLSCYRVKKALLSFIP